MSLTAWHAQLVGVVAAAAPLTRSAGLGATFTHDPAVAVDTDRAFGQRRFGISVVGASPFGPSRPGGVWLRLSCILRLDYLEMPTNAAKLSLAMAEDVAVVVDELANSANWSQATTRIRRVGGQSDTEIATAEMAPVTGGYRTLIRFPVEVTR